mmetsp:Transcript_23779/g.43706  ORF Transcript_23779/g.43706 Transcript_23779/m.43706 type:complete len:284 (+) Transcript_23779:61-912(+)
MTASDDATAAASTAAERKRKRLEAWRKRQQQQEKEKEEQKRSGGFQTTARPPSKTASSAGSGSATSSKPKVKIGLGLSNIKGRKKKKRPTTGRPGAGFLGGEEKKTGDEDEVAGSGGNKAMIGLLDVEELNSKQKRPSSQGDEKSDSPPSKRRRRGRWDVKVNAGTKPAVEDQADTATVENNIATANSTEEGVNDALDAFMMRLEAGAAEGDEEDGPTASLDKKELHLDSSGSMQRIILLAIGNRMLRQHPTTTTTLPVGGMRQSKRQTTRKRNGHVAPSSRR